MSDDESSLGRKNGKGEYEMQSQWKLTQWFRKMEEENEVEMQDHDHISALEFDETGRYLATGDNSGNVVVLENDGPGKNGSPAHFAFFCEFQSHYLDHSFAKAEELLPKITDLKFGPMTNDSVYLLVTSETEIKLWRITPQLQYTIVEWNIPSQPLDEKDVVETFTAQPAKFRSKFDDLNLLRNVPIIKKLRVPRRSIEQVETVPVIRKLYSPDIHTTGIVGLDVTADHLNFLSADCLSVNLWDFGKTNYSYKVIDIKPEDEDYIEILSSVHTHPTDAHKFLYTTSSGFIKTCDLRLHSNPDNPVQLFSHRAPEESVSDDDAIDQNLWEVQEIACSVSDAKFSKGGKFVISRDYMSIRIWDVAMPTVPVETIYVHEYLRDSLVDLKEANYMFDSFKLGLSSRSDVVTGTYGNYFHILDFGAKKDTFIQAGTPQHKVSNLAGLRNMMTGENAHFQERNAEGGLFEVPDSDEESGAEMMVEYPHTLSVEKLDFSSKILNCAWHPSTNTVALTGENNVFVYGKFGKKLNNE